MAAGNAAIEARGDTKPSSLVSERATWQRVLFGAFLRFATLGHVSRS